MALRSLVLVAFLAMGNLALACATCSGPADAPQTQGMNAAILTLFGVLCVVGLTVATFIGVIAWRIAHHQAAPADDVPLRIPSLISLES